MAGRHSSRQAQTRTIYVYTRTAVKKRKEKQGRRRRKVQKKEVKSCFWDCTAGTRYNRERKEEKRGDNGKNNKTRNRKKGLFTLNLPLFHVDVNTRKSVTSKTNA